MGEDLLWIAPDFASLYFEETSIFVLQRNYAAVLRDTIHIRARVVLPREEREEEEVAIRGNPLDL